MPPFLPPLLAFSAHAAHAALLVFLGFAPCRQVVTERIEEPVFVGADAFVGFAFFFAAANVSVGAVVSIGADMMTAAASRSANFRMVHPPNRFRAGSPGCIDFMLEFFAMEEDSFDVSHIRR